MIFEELPSDKLSSNSLPSELPSEALPSKYESPTTKSDGFIVDANSPENSPIHKSSPSADADEFVRTSYDYESGHFEPGPGNNAEMSLHAFISDHGIPIIMDSMGSSDENDGNEMLTDQSSHTLQGPASGVEERSDVGAPSGNIVEDVLCSDDEKNSKYVSY